MAKPLLDGVYCPSISITDASGAFDFDAWEAHLDRLIEAGISGILLFGSIGEFYAFDVAQKREALERLCDHIAHRVPVLFGVSGLVEREVLELTRAATKAKVDAIVALPPYYFAPTDATCLNFYAKIADATDLPLVLYNFPTTTGKDIDAALAAELVKQIPQIKGLKDTVDCASHTRKLIDAVRAIDENFSVVSGFDEYYLTNRIAGGSGVLSGLTNVEPKTFVRMNQAWKAGEGSETIAFAQRISHLMKVYDCADSFISAIKGAVVCKGENIDTKIQPPSVPLTQEQLEKIRAILN